MMSLLETLHAARMDARRAAMDKDESNVLAPYATFLAMTASDINTIAKNDGNRQPTDADAEKALRAQIKQFENLLEGNAAKGIPPLAESAYRTEVQNKRNLLAGFIPKMLDGNALIEAIQNAAVELDTQVDMKAMGKIMGVLNAKYPGLVDGAKVKALISSGV